MIYRYASQDDIDDVVLLPDVVDDVVLFLSHVAAEKIPFLLRGSVEIM
jgi:hypothetical protein